MRAIALAFTLSVASNAFAADFPEPLPIEPTPNVASLPSKYPDTWVYAQDGAFYSMIDGKVVILDLAATSHEFKGQVGAGQFASFLAAKTRPEFYVAETFYSRRIEGERTDTITIYDKSSLMKTGEIVLPEPKRGQFMTQKNTFQFTDGERLGLLFNFTPAASVYVVDLVARKVLNEIPMPGCSLIYPTGKRGFSTLCGNGTMATFMLDENGQVSDEKRTDKFNDIDNDPLFMKTTKIGDTSYFVSFKGRVQPIDFTGKTPKIGKVWSLVDADETAAGWRPAGWHVLTSDAAGRLYVLMQEGGHEGTHKDGGMEVWVFDVKAKKRINRLMLKNHGITVEATKSNPPYLAVVNSDMLIDVYNPETGELLRSLGGVPTQTTFVLQASEE